MAAIGCGWLWMAVDGWMDGNHCHEGARWKVRLELLLLRLMIDWRTKTSSEQWGSNRRKRKEEAIKQYQTISIEHDTVSLLTESVCVFWWSFVLTSQSAKFDSSSQQSALVVIWSVFSVAFDGGGGGHFAAAFVALWPSALTSPRSQALHSSHQFNLFSIFWLTRLIKKIMIFSFFLLGND